MNKLQHDSIAQTDSLGRQKFAKQIVKALTLSFDKVEESIVVGICGKWGSGKTTLLSFIENEIQAYYNNDLNKYRIIKFNPWASTGIDDLQRSLLELLLKELEQIQWKQNVKRVNESIKNYLKYLDHVKFLKYIHPIAGQLFDAVEQYRKKTSLTSLEDLKKQVNELIEEKEIRLYILVDDLDRLDHIEIANIFKTIKLNVNFLNTYFLVAYDKQVVINALKESYHDNAEEYLEKVIQVDFSVPELLEEQLEDVFLNKLDIFIKNLNLEYNYQEIFSIWKYKGMREYFRTPRDIKRYFNSLILSLPNIGEEINLADFVTLEAIKVFDYPAYADLYSSVLEIKRKAIWTSASIDAKFIAKFNDSATQSLLSYLFVENNRLYPMGESLVKKRLKDPEFFERYYSLGISQADISEETLKQFLTVATNKQQILHEAVEYNRIKNLLRRLSDKELGKYHQITDYNIFRSFLEFWEGNSQLIVKELDEYIWNAYFNLAHSFADKHKAARMAIEELVMSENQEQKMRLVFNHFILVFHEANRSDSQFHGNIKEQLDVQFENLSSAFKKNMTKTWGGYFHQINRGLDSYSSLLFLHSFSRYCQPEYLVELRRNLSNPIFLIFILKHCFLLIDSTTGQPARILLDNRKYLLPELMFEHYLKSLREIKKGAISQEDEKLVAFFLQEMKEDYIERPI